MGTAALVIQYVALDLAEAVIDRRLQDGDLKKWRYARFLFWIIEPRRIERVGVLKMIQFKRIEMDGRGLALIFLLATVIGLHIFMALYGCFMVVKVAIITITDPMAAWAPIQSTMLELGKAEIALDFDPASLYESLYSDGIHAAVTIGGLTGGPTPWCYAFGHSSSSIIGIPVYYAGYMIYIVMFPVIWVGACMPLA
jgi:hypothetical protein